MSNPTGLRVYYDEDELLRTPEQAEEELIEEISEIDGVLDVSVSQVFSGHPVEADVVVEFDEMVISGQKLAYKVSTLPFVHNARTQEPLE